MSSWKINLKEQTATSINGITFRLTETKPWEYEGVCLNPKDIPPDDLDDVILGGMIRVAGVFNSIWGWGGKKIPRRLLLRIKLRIRMMHNPKREINKRITGAFVGPCNPSPNSCKIHKARI